MLGPMDKWWKALIGVARLYALAMYCYLSYWAAYSAYTSNYSPGTTYSPDATRSPDGIAEYAIQGLAVEIPIHFISARASECEEVRLYFTRDDGKTWQLAATGMPSEKEIRFGAPDYGVYGFAVQVKYTDGTLDPATPDSFRMAYRVRFGPSSTVVSRKQSEGGGDLSKLRERVETLEKQLDRAEKRKAAQVDEAKALRERIDKLEKRLADLEKDGPENRN